MTKRATRIHGRGITKTARAEIDRTHRIGLHARARLRLYEAKTLKSGMSPNRCFVELRKGRLGKVYGSPVYYEVRYTRLESGKYRYPKVTMQTPSTAEAKREFTKNLKDIT
jgi:hypothetical protein